MRALVFDPTFQWFRLGRVFGASGLPHSLKQGRLSNTSTKHFSALMTWSWFFACKKPGCWEGTPSPRLLGPLSPAGGPWKGSEGRICLWSQDSECSYPFPWLCTSQGWIGGAVQIWGARRSSRGFLMKPMFSVGRVEPAACCCVQ